MLPPAREGSAREVGGALPIPPVKLPPGDIVILIEPISAEVAADEALWDEQFARSQNVLEALGREALAEYEAGLTDDFDPDTDSL